MAEPTPKRTRITPRNSLAASPTTQTPFHVLNALGKLHSTVEKPSTPAPSSTNTAGPRGANGSAKTTPGTTRASARRIPRRGGPPTTPHAIRAHMQSTQQMLRRATPARDRRRSGRLMRDTPRDDLRGLSRLLAQDSRPIPSSPSGMSTTRRVSRAASIVGNGGSPVPDPPRLSMARQDLDDDSFHEAPPRLSVHPDEEDMEDERRAYVRRDDRSSFGDLRFADVLADLEPDIEEEDEGDEVEEGDGMDDVISDGVLGENGTTRNLRELMGGDAELDEDEGPFDPNETEGEPTFQFKFPDRSRTSIGPEEIPTEHLDDVIPAAPEFGREPDSDVEESFLPGMDHEAEGDDSAAEGPADEAAVEDPTDYMEVDGLTADPVVQDPTEPIVTKASKTRVKTPRVLHQSKHGIPYPSLPSAVVKKLASTFSRSAGGNGKINKETVTALTEASDWFFEQVSEDLAAYAGHARRKRIDESDMIALMKRQRRLNDHNTIFSVAQKFLPGELLCAVKMEPGTSVRGKKRKLETITEEDD